MNRLDHLVVTARTLREGVEYVQDTLGVQMPEAGGKHPLMSTHNRLINLGGGAYLEVIAPDPDAPDPGRPRWFELDLFSGEPRLTTWVARVDDLHAHADLGLGELNKASRGNLEWHIAIPADGRLHQGGLVPYLIEWGKAHPTDLMPDSGCALLELAGYTPEPAGVGGVLGRLGLADVLRLEAGPTVRLEARVRTPSGVRALR